MIFDYAITKLCVGSAMLVLAVLSAGCGKETERAQSLVLRRRNNPITGAPAQNQPVDERTAALEMVQQSSVDNEEGVETVGEWVDQLLEREEGQVMFPRWDIRRRGMRKYQVVFTYTLLGDDYTIERKGYSWTVDYVLQLVGQMTRISEEELDRQTGHKSIMQRRAETQERIINLE